MFRGSCQFNELVGDSGEALCVEGCIVHLTLTERSLLPVGHLLTFAEGGAEDRLDDFGESDLILLQIDSLPVCLHVKEPGKQLEEVHLW